MKDNYEYGRHLLQESFKLFIEKYKLPEKLNVSLIGGSDEEPELAALKELGNEINLTKYGIEYYEVFCDLNEINDVEKIDVNLLICANVLEHI